MGISVVERESMAEAESGGERVHIPVLPSAVLAAFARIAPELDGGWIVDGTVGMGGHAELLLEARPSLRLVGCDQDPAALELAGARLARFGGRVELRREHGHAASAKRPEIRTAARFVVTELHAE